MGTSSARVLEGCFQKCLYLPYLSIALENFVHTAWLSGRMYGTPVLIGPWERGQCYDIGSGGRILSMRTVNNLVLHEGPSPTWLCL